MEIIKNNMEILKRLEKEYDEKEFSFKCNEKVTKYDEDIYKKVLINLLNYIAINYHKQHYNNEIKYYVCKVFDPYDYEDYVDELPEVSMNEFIENMLDPFDYEDLICLKEDMIDCFLNIQKYKKNF